MQARSSCPRSVYSHSKSRVAAGSRRYAHYSGSRTPCLGSSTSVQTREQIKAVLVPSSDLRESVQLRLVSEGRGQAIMIEYVSEGSQSRQLGLKAGQIVRMIEDPIRSGQMYELGDRPSLNFVLDAIRMSRHPEIKLQVEDVLQTETEPVTTVPSVSQTDATASSVDRSRSVIATLDSLTGSNDTNLTIAEQLEKLLQELEAEGRAPPDDDGCILLPLVSVVEPEGPSTADPSVLNNLFLAQSSNTEGLVPTNDLQLRVMRRKNYMDQVAERNDTGFFSLLFGAFVIPPAAIIAFAYFSGYLDNLYTNTLSKMH